MEEEDELIRSHTGAVTKLGFEQDRQTVALDEAAKVRAKLGKESRFGKGKN